MDTYKLTNEQLQDITDQVSLWINQVLSGQITPEQLDLRLTALGVQYDLSEFE